MSAPRPWREVLALTLVVPLLWVALVVDAARGAVRRGLGGPR